MSTGIRESTNKFAFLGIQGSSDEAENEWSRVTNKVHTSQKEEPKIEKKKRRRKKKNSSTSHDDPDELDGAEAQLRDWEARDRSFVENLYDEDLRRAIELSKVEYERKERDRSSANVSELTTVHSNADLQHNSLENNSSASKKGKKRSKSRALSLEEFRQRVENSLPLNTPLSKPSNDAKMVRPDRTVDKAVDEIKRYEASKSRFQQEHVKEVHQDTENQQKDDPKDEVIKKLHNKVNDLELKFKQVKKRNKQLLTMLQQGEMKEKSELLLEIERLSQLQSELTQEVTALNQSLEQEKSRSRQYRDELLKLQERVNDNNSAAL